MKKAILYGYVIGTAVMIGTFVAGYSIGSEFEFEIRESAIKKPTKHTNTTRTGRKT